MTRKILPVTMLAVLAATLLAREAVRQDMEREQRETGLTLETFERKIRSINFGTRLPEQRELNLKAGGYPQQGSISRDGESIAFEISYAHPAHWALGVVHADGSGWQEFPEIASPTSICWSNNKSMLAVNGGIRDSSDRKLVIVQLDSKGLEQISTESSVTSQCWSPDDQQIVYAVGKRIRIYDLKEKRSKDLATGEAPAWSPDGNWIGFYREGAYYAIHPSGDGSKILFRRKGYSAGPWWSPDGSVLAYMCSSGKAGNWMGFESRQLRIHRLADSSDDWVLNEPDDVFSPEYEWVLPRKPSSH